MVDYNQPAVRKRLTLLRSKARTGRRRQQEKREGGKKRRSGLREGDDASIPVWGVLKVNRTHVRKPKRVDFLTGADKFPNRGRLGTRSPD